MRRSFLRRPALLLVALLAPAARADHDPKPAQDRPAELLPGLGNHHHPIATRNPEAQKFFDQGLVLLYGFNHVAAAKAFRRAAELDVDAVMPHWGLAYALGPNYNRDMDPVGPERNKAAVAAAKKADELARRDGVPERERAYAAAIARRYSLDDKADPKTLEIAYKDAMKDVTTRFPDDLDAATLYAEAILNLRPWKLWTKDGKPEEGTLEAVAVLEEVLRRHPEHPGANHYYIHAVEATPQPERALPSADRLMTLVPGAGHLVHMPSHIYIHTGDFERIVDSNERAAKADEEYLKRSGESGVYLMYYGHNLHFIVVAEAARGLSGPARHAAHRLRDNVTARLASMPEMADYLAPIPLTVELRFGAWHAVLDEPEPHEKMVFARAFRRYARAVAFAAQGKKKEAEDERKAFAAARDKVSEEHRYGGNSTRDVLKVAAAVLDARLAPDAASAVPHWRAAVAAQDDLAYAEPQDWYYPVRESLGSALLRSGKAAEAEQVFRDDLKKNRRNPRSLFGLMKSLEAQNKRDAAAFVNMERVRVWKAPPPELENY